MDEIVQRILACIDEHGLDQKDLAQKLGVHPQVITAWKNEKKPSKSYRKYVDAIAELFGTTSDYLLTGEKEKPAPETVGELRSEVSQLFGDLTPEEWKQVAAFAAGLKAGREAPATDHT